MCVFDFQAWFQNFLDCLHLNMSLVGPNQGQLFKANIPVKVNKIKIIPDLHTRNTNSARDKPSEQSTFRSKSILPRHYCEL
jgi:hypothetical protein